jgi:hypothetical protein
MSDHVEEKQEVQVNRDDLLTVVDYCWHDERKHYVENPSDVRRPRTGGFLAGHFYAATAGAFSASYASGERWAER